MPQPTAETFKPYRDAIATQARVIQALILRDMQTRFGRTFFGYVIIVSWPLAHLLALMIIYTVVRRLVPFGTSAAVFVATGVLPYILCLYPARMMMISIVHSQALLYFPVVHVFDVIVARGILETITAFWVTAIFLFILLVFGVDVMPIYPEEAILAVLSTIYLAFAIGFLSAVIFKVFKPFIVIQIIIFIAMYISSGAILITSNLPQSLQYWIWFNPLMHSVEWLRSAYYDSYAYSHLSKEYLLAYATVCLFSGVVLERGLRGVLLKA